MWAIEGFNKKNCSLPATFALKNFIFAVLLGEMKGKIILSRVVVVYLGEFLYFSEQTIWGDGPTTDTWHPS